LRFIRALYCVDSSLKPLTGSAATVRDCPSAGRGFVASNPALFHASGFAVHPYPQGLTQPTFVTPFEPDYADFAALPKLERTLDRLQQDYGSSTRFPLWSTEFGYKTNPPLQDMASPSVAAGLLNWSEYLSWSNPRLRSYDQYQLVDPPGSSPSNFATGIEFADGQRKATYAAFRLPIWMPVTRPGGPLEVWGCVRPARFARLDTGQAQRVRIQFERAGATSFRTIAKVVLRDQYGYFDVEQRFPGPGAVRLAWRYPHGPKIFSRTVELTTH
jgi:hypothetical protein